jgi:hypothetical protein
MPGSTFQISRSETITRREAEYPGRALREVVMDGPIRIGDEIAL